MFTDLQVKVASVEVHVIVIGRCDLEKSKWGIREIAESTRAHCSPGSDSLSALLHPSWKAIIPNQILAARNSFRSSYTEVTGPAH
jgi:hypothetical protein